MTTRELQPEEWARFFDCFSRQFHGRPVTVEVINSDEAEAHTLAEQLPLLGITAAPPHGQPESIEVIVGDPVRTNVTHVIRKPRRVRVAQITNGQDEMLLIDPARGPVTRVDFRPVSAVNGVPGAPV